MWTLNAGRFNPSWSDDAAPSVEPTPYSFCIAALTSGTSFIICTAAAGNGSTSS